MTRPARIDPHRRDTERPPCLDRPSYLPCGSHDRVDATPLSLRRKVRGAAAAGQRAAVRWWLLSLAATGATITAPATLLAVALHVVLLLRLRPRFLFRRALPPLQG
ncbi:hypothetical protein OsI_13033 [Oryza sativa Indica Group]|uniref:Uncharacterized protein n=1 Tax=Oryza sativa subsp. indica TaxID=39946 RepID=A2XKP9_ORYSI|nr:hypothetical protein OsI_13033 [Oryza sativa Indica Group]